MSTVAAVTSKSLRQTAFFSQCIFNLCKQHRLLCNNFLNKYRERVLQIGEKVKPSKKFLVECGKGWAFFPTLVVRFLLILHPHIFALD